MEAQPTNALMMMGRITFSMMPYVVDTHQVRLHPLRRILVMLLLTVIIILYIGSFFAAVGGVISLAGVVVTIMNYRSGDLISTKFVRSTFFLGFTFIFAAYLSATSGSAEAADDYDDYVYAGDTIGSVLTGISVLLGFIAVTVDVLTKSKNEPLAENVV